MLKQTLSHHKCDSRRFGLANISKESLKKSHKAFKVPTKSTRESNKALRETLGESKMPHRLPNVTLEDFFLSGIQSPFKVSERVKEDSQRGFTRE